jgi:hypothetical protein
MKRFYPLETFNLLFRRAGRGKFLRPSRIEIQRFPFDQKQKYHFRIRRRRRNFRRNRAALSAVRARRIIQRRRLRDGRISQRQLPERRFRWAARNIFRARLHRRKLYLGGWYEAGSAFENFSRAKYRQSVTGGALLQTRIGPIFVGGSFAEGGRRRLYFSLGRFF